MTISTAAKIDPKLAAALGRFSQACNYLERQIEFTLTRILPLTTDMGRVLFSGNQMRRNIEILAALCLLPELAIPENDRTKLKTLIPRLNAVNADRSRFLHNPIGGMEEPYYLILHKQDAKSSAAMPVTTDLILARALESEALWMELYVAPVDYDLSQWGPACPRYPVKDYPKANSQEPQHQKAQKRKGRPKSEGGKTSQK